MGQVHTTPGYSDGAWWVQFLTSTGLYDGPKEMSVNGSVTPAPFYIEVPENHTWYGANLGGVMTSPAKFDSGGFGSGAVLANGVRNVLRLSPTSPWFDVPQGITWYTNADIVGWAHQMDIHTWGQGDEIMKWLYDAGLDQAPFKLTEGMGYGHIIQDDLTALSSFTVRVAGPMLNNMYRA